MWAYMNEQTKKRHSQHQETEVHRKQPDRQAIRQTDKDKRWKKDGGTENKHRHRHPDRKESYRPAIPVPAYPTLTPPGAHPHTSLHKGRQPRVPRQPRGNRQVLSHLFRPLLPCVTPASPLFPSLRHPFLSPLFSPPLFPPGGSTPATPRLHKR